MLNVKILTPKNTLYAGSVDSVYIPTKSGEVGILTYHENYIASIGTGKIEVEANGSKEIILCKGGFAKTENNILEVLVDDAVMANDLVIEKIKESEAKAQQEVQRTDITASDLLRLEKVLRYEKFKREFAERNN